MRYLSYLCLTIALSSASGCTSTLDYQKQLAKTPSCCEQLHTIRYQPATYNKALTINMGGKKAPARQFLEGKSFFAAIRLPAYNSPYEIKIASEPIRKQLFWPTIQILDINYQVVEEINADTFTYSNGELNNSFFINQDLGYRYLIIYTKPQLIGKSGEARNVGTTNVYIPTGTSSLNLAYAVDQKQKITTSAGGKIKVELVKYQPRTLK